MPKGQNYEREMCRKISLWWSGGEDDNLFWRTANSGGRATTRAKAGKRADKHCGDICSIDVAGDPLMKVLSIEFKKGYNRATIHDLLDKPARAKTQTYEEWFAKAERDRQRAGALYWALVHKRDRHEEIIYTQEYLMESLLDAGAFGGGMSDVCPSLGMDLFVGKEQVRIIAMRLWDFFDSVRPEHVLKVLTNNKEAV